MFDKLTIKSKYRDYDVIFVDSYSQCLEEYVEGNTFFLIDHNVYEQYKMQTILNLPQERIICIEAEENNKNLDYCQSVMKKMIERDIRRGHTLIAIGGGITQDISAFIASILFRGIKWVFFPTTLLAQADSCIGGKTSINFMNYKNLLGNFYPPEKIIIDMSFLETLSEDDIKSGIGEILHFYLVDNNEDAKEIADKYEYLLKNRKYLVKHIHTSLNIKKKMVEIDEFDKGPRNIFNYGHTFGHAIESISEYRINHGQAITLGMDMANYLSLHMGNIDKETYNAMLGPIKKNIPHFSIKGNFEKYIIALSKDKKNEGDKLGCILPFGLGQMKKVQIPLDDKIKSLIASYFDK